MRGATIDLSSVFPWLEESGPVDHWLRPVRNRFTSFVVHAMFQNCSHTSPVFDSVKTEEDSRRTGRAWKLTKLTGFTKNIE
jgi:hypothetical protein